MYRQHVLREILLRENFQLARERIAIIAVVMGEAIGNIIAVAFYWTFFVPFAIGSRLTSDPLRRQQTGDTFWLDRDPVSTELDRAKRQG